MAAENARPRDRPSRATPAKYHPRLAQDFEFAFKICATDLPQKFDRQIVLSELRDCLDSTNLGGVEGQYEVVDFSMHTWGLPDFAAAPIELVLVDKHRPDGIPPTHGDAPLPLPYDSIQLARYLSEQGYEGSFMDMQIDFANSKKQTPANSQKSSRGEGDSEVHEVELDGTIPEPRWSIKHEISYTESQERLPMPPASLRIKQRSANPNESRDPLRFVSDVILYPAHPSNYHRMALLKSCCARSDFQAILSSFWLWAQSWDLSRLTPTICALIVILYLQKIDAFPPLRTAGASEKTGPANTHSSYYWARRVLSSAPEPVYYRNDIPALPPDLLQIKTEILNSQIAEFFEFWATDGSNGPQCKDFVFSIEDGKEIARTVSYCQPSFKSRKGFWKRLALANKTFFSEDGLSLQNTQSPIWQFQAFVIEDPFVRHHNAAHIVTNSMLSKLRQQAKYTSQLLKKGCSPLETFGPAISERRISRSYMTDIQVAEGFFYVPPLEQTVHERRNWTMFLVNDVVRKQYGGNYHVECFGSTRYGVDSATSDLDLVIVDAARPLGFCYNAKLPAIYNVRDLGTALHFGGFKVESVIPQAAVPIVKFYDARNRIHCDINVNDQLGLFNTQMIAHYCEIFRPLPTLLLAVKKWAKSLGLNNPSGRGATSFSSYALAVMTIGYLQISGILPNLQAGLFPLPPPPRNPERDVEGVFWQRERTGPPKRCDRRFFRVQFWRPPEGAKLDIYSLLLGWFRYWGHQHEYATQLMSIRDGALLARAVNAASKRKEKKRNLKKSKGKAEDGVEDANATDVREESPPRPQTEPPSIGIENLSIKDDPEEKSEESEEENVQDADAEGTAEDLATVDLANGKQPRWWKNASLVVGDPFILTKNITGSVSQRVIERFKADCRRAVLVLEHGGAFEDLLGTGEPLTTRSRDNPNAYPAKGRIRPQKPIGKKEVTSVTNETAVKQENNVVG